MYGFKVEDIIWLLDNGLTIRLEKGITKLIYNRSGKYYIDNSQYHLKKIQEVSLEKLKEYITQNYNDIISYINNLAFIIDVTMMDNVEEEI
jgi:hypothetical protein